jgi:DNA-binding CsgD family transcriptional regulator
MGFEIICRCAFCGRNQQEVPKLGAGPGVYICNECVADWHEIFAEPGQVERLAGDEQDRVDAVIRRSGHAEGVSPAPARLQSPAERQGDESSKRESDILSLRLGLGGVGPLSREEVAERFSITPERVRQIELRILAKLRHPKSGE